MESSLLCGILYPLGKLGRSLFDDVATLLLRSLFSSDGGTAVAVVGLLFSVIIFEVRRTSELLGKIGRTIATLLSSLQSNKNHLSVKSELIILHESSVKFSV